MTKLIHRSMLILTLAGLAASALAEPGRTVTGFDGMGGLTQGELDTLRGANGNTSIHVASHQKQEATVHDSTIIAGQVNTGSVKFGDGAMGGFSGIYNNIINTGNNNSINGGMNVTIYLQ